jgi:hypothetical protein
MRHPDSGGVVEVTDAQFEIHKENGWEKAPDDAVLTADITAAERAYEKFGEQPDDESIAAPTHDSADPDLEALLAEEAEIQAKHDEHEVGEHKAEEKPKRAPRAASNRE